MKYYLIQYTTSDKWEMQGGIYIISAKNKKSALEIFRTKHHRELITEVILLKSSKEKVLYHQSPVIE